MTDGQTGQHRRLSLLCEFRRKAPGGFVTKMSRLETVRVEECEAKSCREAKPQSPNHLFLRRKSFLVWPFKHVNDGYRFNLRYQEPKLSTANDYS